MKYTPINEYIIAELLKPEEVSSGGIVLSPSSIPENVKAKVLSVGPGRTSNSGVLIPNTLKVDDVVVLSNSSFRTIEDNIITFTEDDILGLVVE